MDHKFLRKDERDLRTRVTFLYVEIDGSELSTSLSTSGVTLGKDFCTAKDNGSNQVTITLNRPNEYTLKIWNSYSKTADVDVVEGSCSEADVVYTTVKKTDGTSVADADVRLTLALFHSSAY